MILRSFAAAAALTFGLGGGAAWAESDAPNQHISAVYDFFIGGVKVAEASLVAELTDAHYRARTDVRSTGLMDAWLTARFASVADGALDDQGRVGPRKFQMRYETQGQLQTAAIDYSSGRPKRTLMHPPLTDQQEPIDPFLQGATLDPTSALLAGLTTHIDPARICNRSIPIFDGRWRYDVLLLPFDPSDSDDDAPPPEWSGPLSRCYGVYERIGGFLKEILETERFATFEIWFEEPTDGVARAVRIAGRSRLGYVVANLRLPEPPDDTE